MQRQDFKLINNDLHINPSTGDFEIGFSDFQHIQDTINAFPGWWKENSQIGVGVFGYVGSAGKQQELKRLIRVQLEADGYTPDGINISFSDGQMTVIIEIDGQTLTFSNA
jgi:hypothetical protein